MLLNPSTLAMLEENQAILKTGLDVIKKEGDTIERVVLNLNIYLMVTLVGEYCSWRWTILEMKLHSTANVKIIFFNQNWQGEGGQAVRLPRCWFYVRLPVKSSATNCQNTYDQDWGVF